MRVTAGSTPVAPTARREQILLAMLLLHVDECVPMERLVDAVWSDRPPRNAPGQLQGSVHRLRRSLAAAGAHDLVVTEPGGYRLRVDPRAVDLWEFRRLLAAARAAASGGDPDAAARHYRTGLELWRGAALAGIDSAVVQQYAVAIDEERARAQEECIELELGLGRAGELVAELTGLVQRYPYRERLHATLLRALYAAGRPADALAAYQRARQLFQDELGTDPGPELQHLHRAILDRDPALELAPAGSVPPASPGRFVPRELPADVAGFTGRAEALAVLDRRLSDAPGDLPGPVIISAIAGMAGVGKTALAVHWAQRNTDRFPDGQVYVNLRGYDPDRPMTPAEALARLLSSFGVADQDIPLELTDRAARYRSEVAGRRMLIVLDNAATVEQVRQLLPGTGSVMVLVTSRDSLAGLVTRHGAHRLDLDLLPPDEAVTLLRGLIGDRVDAEPGAAAALARQSARLPLALRVAAELAISRPTLPLAKLVVELEDQQRRLDLLDAGDDPHAAVKVVFSWSMQHLPPEAVHVFRLLGLHPGPDIDRYATAALAGVDLAPASQALDRLARAHLVHPTGPGRFGMHDLLRAYACQLATAEYSDPQRRAAQDRLFDYYLGAAAVAMDRLYPAEAHRRPRIPPPASPTPELPDPGAARGWLDAERPCLVAAAAHAASHGWPGHAIGLSGTLFRYLDGGHFTDGLAVHDHAHQAARQTGDLVAQAHALRRLGAVQDRMGRLTLATEQLERALELFRRAGDESGEAVALHSLSIAERRLGQYESASERQRRALALFRRVGDRTGEASSLTGLGVIGRVLGRYEAAADYLRQAVTVSRLADDLTDEAFALNNLGNVEQDLGDHRSAAEHHRRALELFRQLGHLDGEAHALDNLGSAQLGLGQPELAARHLEQALALFRKIGDREGQASALDSLGAAAGNAGRPLDALSCHTTALIIATEIGDPTWRARSYAGIGRAYQALGDPVRARDHYRQALAAFADLDLPEVAELRNRLAALTGDQEPAA
jgi:DNA-binding SARP family transcriptional activator/Tfp pilus assembly protein PilF